MKTIELLNEYKHNTSSIPEELWKRLVWMAANLVREAEISRNTARRPTGQKKTDDRQMELF